MKGAFIGSSNQGGLNGEGFNQGFSNGGGSGGTSSNQNSGGNFGGFSNGGSSNSASGEGNFPPGSFGQPAPVSVTIGDVPVVLGPGNVVIGTRTFTPGLSPTSIVYNGQTFGLDASRLISPQTTVAIPRAAGPGPALVTAGGQVFTVGPSGLEAPGLTVPIPSAPQASAFVYKGQTFKINPSQIIATDRLVAIPNAPGPTPPPAFVFNGETFSVDGSRVIAPSTILTLSPGSNVVVYKGQTLTIQPSQIVGPSTTIPVANPNRGPITAPPSAITAAGLAFSLGPGAVIIGSSTFSFLPGQTPTTIVYQGTTISIGSSGIGFAGTTIPIPTPPPSLSTVNVGGLAIAVGPSQAVIGGRTFFVGPNIPPTKTVVDGKTVSIGPQGVGVAGTTVPLPGFGDAVSSTVTVDGLTFTVGPSQAVIGGRTFSVGPNIPSKTTVVDGKTVSIGPQGIGLVGTTIPLPSPGDATVSTITADGLTFTVGASKAVIEGRTFSVGPNVAATTAVIDGKTISIGPQGIGLAGTTIPLPNPTAASFQTVTAGGLTFVVNPTEAIISGRTFAIGSGIAPITTVIDGQRISIGPGGIGLATTTVALPPPSASGYTVLTEGDLTFTVGPSQAIIGGKTFNIVPGAAPITTTINGQIVTIGPKGIAFAGTTAAIPSATAPAGASIVTIDGITITLEPTAAVINGKTYGIGIGAVPTTIVVGTETISLGPGGVGLPTTTIAPPPSLFTGGVHSGVAPGASLGSGSLIATGTLAGFVLLLLWI